MNVEMGEPRFAVGDMVSLRADPSRQGMVMTVLSPAGGRPRYRVFHSASEQRDYYEAQLVPVSSETEAVATASEILAGVAGDTVDAGAFRARLTAARLNHPQIDHLYALHAARIRFVPFQLKPLLRFLHADQPRLLIADEVGVGKTIEAGLILREMQARQQVGNVLIVCPKALVTKWRAEMLRFDEQFETLDGPTLRYCLREAHLDGVWPQRFSRAIVHLELLRGESHLVGAPGKEGRPGLLELDPPPTFSLTIVDEAHHLRNPETRSHELARFLCDASEAVIFLSATPVHVGSQNLFTLLNLLRPDMFIDKSVFASMVEPNQYINTAMRHVRHPQLAGNGDWRDEAAHALDTARMTTWGAQTLAGDPRLTHWLNRLRSDDDFSDIERVRCLRDLEEAHTLAHVMNRTRRRDIGRFTIREPHTVSVEFTPEQETFYNALIELRKQMLLLEHDPFVVRLIIDTLERQASSCLPALIPLLDRFLRTGRFAVAEMTDDDEAQSESDAALPAYLVEQAGELRELANSLPTRDPKLERLLKIAATTRDESGPGKLLLFSFFLHTLGYLHEHLRAAGYRTAIITGKVKDEEREVLRNRFRLPRTDPHAIDILLSSEVGCEGLDYEFCDRMVNYDIPWNPMRVEQRIGRIDRFGQRSDKVMIYNFITPGTVEERIFFRCFERIGVFRDTVGDLEEILSETVQDLTRAALDPRLTPEQLDLLTQQKTHNVILLAEEQQRLEQQGSALLGLERAFIDEVDDLIADGRFVAPSDLAQMVDLYLGQPELNGRLTPDTQDARLHRLRLNRNARMHVGDDLRNQGIEPRDRASLAFQRWLDGDEPMIALTFDQALALEHRDLTFITPVHPLARAAARHWSGQREPLLARLSVESDIVPPGRYLFACDLWESVAVHSEVQIVSHVWDIDRWSPDATVAANLVALLSRATSAPVEQASAASLDSALGELDEQAHASFSKTLDDLRERNGHVVTRRLASLNSYYTGRLQRIERDIATASDPRIQRMRHSERDRVEREYTTRQREIDTRRDADIVSQRVATGLLTIRPVFSGDADAV